MLGNALAGPRSSAPSQMKAAAAAALKGREGRLGATRVEEESSDVTVEDQGGQEIRAPLLILVTTPFLRLNSRKTDHPLRQASYLTHSPLHVFPTGSVRGGGGGVGGIFAPVPTMCSKIRSEESFARTLRMEKRDFMTCKDG